MLTLIDLTTINKNQKWLKIFGTDFSISLPKGVSTETINDEKEDE